MIIAAEFDDVYLVSRTQDGYVDAYEELVLRYGPRVYRIAMRMLGDHFEAQDLAQEAFIAAWKSIDKFRGHSQFSTWLYQIVTRLCLNRLNRGPAAPVDRPTHQLPDPADNPAEHTEKTLRGAALTYAIGQLPSAQRIVIVLHHIEGLPYAEVATITHSTVASVRSNLFRARRTLAHTLQEWR